MRIIISIFILLFCSINIHAQQYNFIKYSVQEGLSNAEVTDLMQDDKGYLWVATQGGGVNVFDGDSFRVIGTEEGLRSGSVHCLYEGFGEQVWFGTQKGLVRYSEDKVQQVYLKERIVYSIAKKEDGYLWLGTDKGLYVLNESRGEATKHRIHNQLNIAKVRDLKVVDGALWMGSSKGLFILKGDHVEVFDGLLSKDVMDLGLDGQGHLWVAQKEGGVMSINPKNKKVAHTFNTSFLQRANCVKIDSKNIVWVGTENKGLQRYDHNTQTWSSIGREEGLANDNVATILSDAVGNLWVGTKGGGVSKFLGQFFSHYTSDTGLNGNRIYAVAEDRKGAIWIGVDDKGVTKIDSTGIRTDVDGDYINTKCHHIMEDTSGRIWMSTAGGGLVMKDSQDYWVFNELDGLPSSWISSTAQDIEGDIWVGTYADGLARIISADSLGIQVASFGIESGLPDPFITVLSKNNIGDIWFGTKKGGIGFLDNQSVMNMTVGSKIPRAEIRSIVFDAQEQIWIGVVGYGLYYRSINSDSPRFQSFAQNSKLASKNINQLVFDREGHLWVGTDLGLDKIILDQEASAEILHFGRNEGFLGIESSPNAVVADRKGHLWFGTQNGLSKHVPGSTQLSVAPPKVHFTDVNLPDHYSSPFLSMRERIFSPAYSIDESHVFRYLDRSLEFTFKAVNLDYPRGIQYQWKMDGLEEDWSTKSNSTSVNYANLSPGKYKFLVKAVNQAGLESDVISKTIDIRPSIWQSRIFQFAALCFLALIGYLFFRFRINKIRKRESAKRTQLELENELLGLEQKALQLQMNPHFIFNALNSIQSVVVTQKTDIARDQIQNFAGLMRGILTNSKKASITLQEEFNTLDKYLKLEQFCQTKPFDFEILLPTGHDPDEIEIPPMMIQPFVENAVFHGVSHLEDRGHIKVLFAIQGELLSCSIIDNGVGRQKAASLKTKKSSHQSVAIEVTRKRLESLRGQKNYTAFSIDDVLNEEGEVRGTKVILQLPLKLTF